MAPLRAIRALRVSKKALWDAIIGLAGLLYIALALSRNVQSPVFAAAFILAAGYELVESHSGRHKT